MHVSVSRHVLGISKLNICEGRFSKLFNFMSNECACSLYASTFHNRSVHVYTNIQKIYLVNMIDSLLVVTINVTMLMVQNQ